ncbi:MAG: hypothetical protein KC442_06425 [Thermomicrobiales bacterium]|nr:hypothetical protein [Thermomicrobiales bacterium]
MLHISRRPLLAGILALSVLLPGAALPAAAQDHAHNGAIRVMAADAESGELTVLDPGSGEIVGQFSTPVGGYAALYPSSTGRYLLVNHYAGDQVTIVDAGIALVPHGDHADLVTAPPFVRATLLTGPTPAHYWAHDGHIAIANDGDGTITLLDEGDLADELSPRTFAVAQPDHSSIAILDDAVLVGYYDLGRVDAYSLDGSLIAENLGACPGAHGEAAFADSIVFACADGLLRITHTDGEFQAQPVAYPAPDTAGATPTAEAEPTRSGSLAAHHDSDVLVGDFGKGLALIVAGENGLEFAVLDLPAAPLAFAYDDAGAQVAVLTDDGMVHGVDPAQREILWSTPAVTPYTAVELGDGFDFYPAIAASETAVFVPDPGTGEVVEIALDNGAVTQRLNIGGKPARVTLTEAHGVTH